MMKILEENLIRMLVFPFGSLVVSKTIISTTNSPEAIGPYSQAVNIKGGLFSGNSK